MRFYFFLLGLLFTTGMIAVGSVVALYGYYAPTLPPVQTLRDIELETPLQVFTADERLIAEFAEIRRIPVTLDAVPLRLQQAFIAAEDERFYLHPGVDPVGLLRAALHLLSTGDRAQGGSTITMQLARNFFLTPDRTYERKIREIFLAIQIERTLTKDQILELYLNKIYLGQRAYGIRAAALIYFNRELDELELDQMAILAALPKAPSTTNPVASPTRAQNRRNYVLRRMHELQFIGTEEYHAALEKPVQAQRFQVTTEVEAHWVAETARQIVAQLYGEQVYRLGLRVFTTIDSTTQVAANQALRDGLLAYDRRHGYRGPERRLPESSLLDADQRLQALQGMGTAGRLLHPAIVLEVTTDAVRVEMAGHGEQWLPPTAWAWAKPLDTPLPNGLQRGDVIRLLAQPEGGWEIRQIPEVTGALLAQSPEDGAILALTSGFDFFANSFNRALQAERQPGSSFKSLIYAIALHNGMTPASPLIDAPLVFTDPALGAEWRPENYTRRFEGTTNMRAALAHSRNLATIRLLDSQGVGYVHDHLVRFGLSPQQHPRNLSMALGTGSLNPAQLNNAYATFANGGRLTTPWLISRIEDRRGTVLYESPTSRSCRAPCAQPAGQDLVLRTAHGPLQFSEPQPTLDPGVAWQMSQILRETIRIGTGRAAQSLGRTDLAGKTGTTNAYRDAWFVGFNADVVATAWVGFDDNRELQARETGGRAALPIWIDFMRQTLAGRPEAPVPRPQDLVQVTLLPETGERVRDNDPRGRQEWLLPVQIPPLSTRLTVPPSTGAGEVTPASITTQQPEFIF